MRVAVLLLLAIVLALGDAVLAVKPPRGTPQGRTVFSRFANSRFPFFTVDLARFQNKVPASGRKRSVDFQDNGNVHSDLNEDIINLAPTEKVFPKDVAEAIGVFDERHIGNLDVITEEFSGFDNAPEDVVIPTAKRSELHKRIHTCAFMRRLGVPIGLCFSNLRRLKEENKNKIQAQRPTPVTNPYEYLERQLQGHTMLGGGVGKR